MPRGVLPVGRPKTKYLQWLWTFVLWSEHYSKLHFHKSTEWDSPIWSGIKVFNPFHYIFGCPFANIFWCIQNHQTHFYNLIIGYLICDKLHPFVWEIFFSQQKPNCFECRSKVLSCLFNIWHEIDYFESTFQRGYDLHFFNNIESISSFRKLIAITNVNKWIVLKLNHLNFFLRFK